jgi:phosphatidylglycerophosphate synthase
MIAFRWQLPESPLRASALAAEASGLVLVVLAAQAIGSSAHLGAAYPLKAGAIFLVAMSVAIGFLHDAHPFARFGAANRITTLRLVLVSLVAGLAAEPAPQAGAGVAVAASVMVTALDGVDGWLARERGMMSTFGARFDMEIDALLIMTLSVLALREGKAGAWVLASGLLRYLFVGAGWALAWMNAPLPPSRRRQTVCVVQVIALIVVIAPFVLPPASTAIAAAALVILGGSFLVDTLWLKKHAE